MKISARVNNREGEHQVYLQTNENVHSIPISPKQEGFGSRTNGGELLFLALATCYCNDIYREAAKRGIAIRQVEVEVSGDFGAEGAPASNITYQAKIAGDARQQELEDLMRHTDTVAEIQNTLRAGTPVELAGYEIISG